jgi:hypothetical protein
LSFRHHFASHSTPSPIIIFGTLRNTENKIRTFCGNSEKKQ